MIEQNLDLATGNGTMSTFVTHPETGGPFPVVLFLMDAPGKREELHDMARRISANGYYVMLPNLYYRDTASFTVHREDPASAQYMYELMGNLTNRMVAEDVGDLIRYAEATEAADASAVGVTGYCMSGPFALWVAAEFPNKIKAAATIHGVRLAVDGEDSPHSRASEISAEVLVMAAERDHYVDKPHFDRLVDALDTAGVQHTSEWIMDVDHGFVFPQRPLFNKSAAERHWELLSSLFSRTLRNS